MLAVSSSESIIKPLLPRSGYMRRFRAFFHAFCFSLTVVTSGTGAENRPSSLEKPEEARVVAEIKKHGGRVAVDETNPSKPVLSVDLENDNPFTDIEVTDRLLGCLKSLTSIRKLNLAHTNVTDATLEQLKGLTTLQSLNLSQTKVTDLGLAHLNGLTDLQSLDLSRTKVSNKGLKCLKEFKQNAQAARTLEGTLRSL